MLEPHVYCFDMIAGGQGAEKKAGHRCGFFTVKQQEVLSPHTKAHTLTCGNVGAGAGWTVTLASLCRDCCRVSFAAQEICKGARSSS